MKVELFSFQKQALIELRKKLSEAMGSYYRTMAPQVISFTAPTGAGKTIIMSALIESIFYGDAYHMEQPDSIIVWLSDSPQLNEQSKLKIDGKADKIRLGQCVTISDESFDQEVLQEGHIYFLNTQKLSASSNLTKHGDSRTYTIWETLANTVKEKSDHLYFIIDEAHRGMKGKEAGKATTIMQKFLKGSESDHIPPMPVVIGMSATMKRFNQLVENTTSSIHKVIVTPDAVRASGLLKDKIIITYPEKEAANNDMAVLQAAADDWNEKWDHWTQYCREQHYAYVNPVFIIQVLNGSHGNLSDTDLSDCLHKIEERIGAKFGEGQVVHTFGQTDSTIEINGLSVRYVEPSRIAEDKNIRIVFFKENLTTGWDCPRAETMMSFKHVNDATYIAQLLGRMVRTPMQMRIQVDEVLNDVHLYLPHFNQETAKTVVEELQSSEGGEIPTDIYGDLLGHSSHVTLSARNLGRNQRSTATDEGPMGSLFADCDSGEENQSSSGQVVDEVPFMAAEAGNISLAENPGRDVNIYQRGGNSISTNEKNRATLRPILHGENTLSEENSQAMVQENLFDFDREAVVRFINRSGLLTYHVRSVQITNYLKSLYALVHLLTQNNLWKEAVNQIHMEIAEQIHQYVIGLKNQGQYDDLVQKVKQFKLATQIFDAFGQSMDNYFVHELFTTTDSDIDRQFGAADNRLGSEGIGRFYGKAFMEDGDYSSFKVDVILFVADENCMNELFIYAKKRFHELNDMYRRKIAMLDSEKAQREYDKIVSNGDAVSKHNFKVPETITISNELDGKTYTRHLYADENGEACFKLNTWEDGVIEEEGKREDFVCWIRNPARAPWALCIPYELNGIRKPAYPDFLIIRKDAASDYVMDILEPHDSSREDNLGKAKGFAEYARQNPGIGRIQLIRMSKDAAGQNRFKRLDMSKSSVRDKVSHAMNNEELNHIFDTDGFFD